MALIDFRVNVTEEKYLLQFNDVKISKRKFTEFKNK